jgi:hypothetical protein
VLSVTTATSAIRGRQPIGAKGSGLAIEHEVRDCKT